MKKTKILVAVLGLLFVVMCTVAVVIHFNNKKNFKANPEKYMASIAIKGYEMKIPDKYSVTVDSDFGIMYWDYDNFDMMIDIAELSYDEDVYDKMDELNELMSEELDVIRPYSEFTIDGKSYIYMIYYNEGVPTIHGYSRADDNKAFELMVLCYEMELVKPQTDDEIRVMCEKLIGEADSIIRTAKKTDKTDTPSGEVIIGAEAYENLHKEVEINMSDKFIDHDFVQGVTTKATANYKIKQDYYCTGSKTKEDICYLKYYSDYKGTLVTVCLKEKDNATYNVKKEIEEGCKNWGDDTSIVEEYVVGTNKFYHYSYSDEYAEEDRLVKTYKYVSAADLGNGYIYYIGVKGETEDVNNPEFCKEFMDVNLSKPQ